MRRARSSILVVIFSIVTQLSFAYALDLGSKDAEKVILTRKDIDEINATDIVDLLNRVPGVSASDSSVKIRGSTEVKVLLDGRPLNDPLARHSAVKWGMVSINTIESIEIYKGSGAVAFGDGTSGGAICITSKKINNAQGKVKTAWGNLNTQQYNFNYNRQVSSFNLGLSADYFHTDNYRENQDKEKKSIGIKAAYRPEKDMSYDFYCDYTTEEKGNAGYPSNPTPHSREKSESYNPGVLINAGRLKSNTYFGKYRKRSVDPDKSLYTLLNGWSFGEEASNTFSLGKFGDITTGLSFGIDHVTGNTIPSHQEESLGLSASKSIKFSPMPLSCTIGLRANLYSDFENVLNPEIKLGYDWNRTKLQFLISKTNNIPTILKRYYETSTTRANPDLRMEKAMNYSFSVSRSLKNYLEGSVALFYNKITDRITYVRGSDGTGTYENFGEVTYRGAEATLGWKPCVWFKVTPSYTYLIAKDEQTDLWITASPKHQAKIDIQYVPVSGLTFTFTPKYVDKQFTRSDNKEYAKPYCIVECRVDYSFKSWRLFTRIENITGKTYLYGDGLPAPPRKWLVGASFEF